MAFKIKIGTAAIDDIQAGIDWYNQQQDLLGRTFLKEVKTHIKILESNPYLQVRYDNEKLCY